MTRASILLLTIALAIAIPAPAQTPSTAPLKVVRAGLAHGHAIFCAAETEHIHAASPG